MSEKSILKPCPFCGGAAHRKKSWLGRPDSFAIGCGSHKDCPAKNDEQDEQGGFSCEFRTEEEATNNWNTRPVEDKLESRVKLLEAMTDKLAEAVKLAYNDKLSPLSFHKVMAELKIAKDKRNE